MALLGALLCFRSTVSWESIGWGAALGYGIWIALTYLFTEYNKIDNQENVHNHQHFHSGNFGNFSEQQQFYDGTRSSFIYCLLVLSAYIIKVNGRTMHSEIEFVRNFFRQNFWDSSVQQAE